MRLWIEKIYNYYGNTSKFPHVNNWNANLILIITEVPPEPTAAPNATLPEPQPTTPAGPVITTQGKTLTLNPEYYYLKQYYTTFFEYSVCLNVIVNAIGDIKNIFTAENSLWNGTKHHFLVQMSFWPLFGKCHKGRFKTLCRLTRSLHLQFL